MSFPHANHIAGQIAGWAGILSTLCTSSQGRSVHIDGVMVSKINLHICPVLAENGSQKDTNKCIQLYHNGKNCRTSCNLHIVIWVCPSFCPAASRPCACPLVLPLHQTLWGRVWECLSLPDPSCNPCVLAACIHKHPCVHFQGCVSTLDQRMCRSTSHYAVGQSGSLPPNGLSM